MNINIETITEVNVSRCKKWHGVDWPAEDHWTVGDWSNALMGEVGELCNVIKKIRRDEEGTKGANDPGNPVLRAMAGQELADCYLYLDLLAFKLGRPLADILNSKWGYEQPFLGHYTLGEWGNRLAAKAGLVADEIDQGYPVIVGRSKLRDVAWAIFKIADLLGIDIKGAIVEKFDAVSAREGFPDKLGGLVS